jgi:hypothetical protein
MYNLAVCYLFGYGVEANHSGTQFTRFTSTKVQKLTHVCYPFGYGVAGKSLSRFSLA